jgi:hypothetical protein
MPKGISRNPRTDQRRKKNRISKIKTKAKPEPSFVDVGPLMNFEEAMKSVRERTGTLPMDMVNHPSHYTAGGIETIDFIEAKQLNYHLGQVIKYVTRAEYKNNFLEDLKKAQWYLNREIENRSKT